MFVIYDVIIDRNVCIITATTRIVLIYYLLTLSLIKSDYC